MWDWDREPTSTSKITCAMFCYHSILTYVKTSKICQFLVKLKIWFETDVYVNDDLLIYPVFSFLKFAKK